MRRSLWDRVGPFDTTFRNTGDYDMYARCRAVAAPLILQEVIGRFRLHGDQLSFRPEVMARESRRVQEKNGTVSRAGLDPRPVPQPSPQRPQPPMALGEEDGEDPLHAAGLSGGTGARMRRTAHHAPVSSVRPPSGRA